MGATTAQLGLETTRSSHYPQNGSREQAIDHFVRRDGLEFAGTHLIFDFWQASGLDNLQLIEQVLKQAVEAAEATLLHIHLHHFTATGGVSGVAVLAESHITIHTWPERAYAAFDVFMCGDAKPHKTLDVFRRAFKPEKLNVTEHLRGMVAQGD